MDVSIVIVNFNTSKLTKGCIKSIKDNPPQGKYEIIVIDNGSDEKLSLDESKNLKVIKNDSNFGFSKANNQGIRRASGKYVLLLNSDTEVKPGSIDKLIDFAERKTDAGVVVPRLLNADRSVQASVFRFPTVWLAIRQYWLGEKGLFDKYIPETDTVDEAVMAAYLITPRCLREVGMLDERYFFFFEDFDYARRVRAAGLKIYYLKDSEVIHYHGQSGKKITNEENQWRRLVPGSKIYHGILNHNLITFVMWTSQKWKKLLNQK